MSGRLQRQEGITLHPVLFNTPLIYNSRGRVALDTIYRSYYSVAQKAELPLLLCAPTWRLDRTRVFEAGVPRSINGDAVQYLVGLQEGWPPTSDPVLIGGLLAPKNDCYDPLVALSRKKAANFHAWQICELAKVGVDLLIAQTMPAVSEAAGMADILAETGIPYIISFVINRFGNILDTTPLHQAIDTIDQSVKKPPACYMVNCVYPTFICASDQPPELFTRLAGIQANGSSKDHDQLDNATQLHQDSLEEWGRQMIILHKSYHMKILGGCCGTDHTHLQHIATHLTS